MQVCKWDLHGTGQPFDHCLNACQQETLACMDEQDGNPGKAAERRREAGRLREMLHRPQQAAPGPPERKTCSQIITDAFGACGYNSLSCLHRYVAPFGCTASLEQCGGRAYAFAPKGLCPN
jgi:hypothetical protein